MNELGGGIARIVTYTSVSLLVIGLGIWKYANFLIVNINQLTNLLLGRKFLYISPPEAPFGISYGFLILISYIFGIYWGMIKAKTSFLEYIHTVAFFPLWVMGPILGIEDIKEESSFKVTYRSLTIGLQRICWGIFKKLVLSERCSVMVNTIYGDPETYGGFYVVFGSLLFIVQLYSEFSGAMDIVLGAGEIIGKKLPENFNHPFSSTSISEFWRRWHITLGSWLKNFILYPILKTSLFLKLGKNFQKCFGKKRGKKLVTYCGLFLSWFLIGLWHGGKWNFIFGSGIYYWILIVGGETAQPFFKWIIKTLKINTSCWSYQSFLKIRTTLLFSIGMIFFRAGGFKLAINELKALISVFNPWIFVDGSLFQLGLDVKDFIVCVIALLIFAFISNMQKQNSVRKWLSEQNLVFRWMILYALIFSIVIFGCYGEAYDAAAFIYQEF